MVTLRATLKVLRRLSQKPVDVPPPDTALGDWFVNRFVVDRQPLLLLLSSTSLLPIVEPARDLRNLPQRLPAIVRRRLEDLGVARTIIEREVARMQPVLVAKTNDRSVLGTMNDFVFQVPFHVPEGVRWGDDVLPHIEVHLEGTPCRCGRRDTIWPRDKALELLFRAPA